MSVLDQADHDCMVASVARRYGDLAYADAEDAVQTAWLRSLEMERDGKGPSGGGGVVSLAYRRASDIARRRGTVVGGAASIEALAEQAGDLLAPRAPDTLLDQVEARLALRELAADAPGGRAALKASRRRMGQWVRYERDEVVDAVRGYVHRHGRVPTYREFDADPLCPSGSVVHGLGGWAALVREGWLVRFTNEDGSVSVHVFDRRMILMADATVRGLRDPQAVAAMALALAGLR